MTPEQVKMVQDSFQKVVPIAGTAADLFYDRLFEIAPEVRPLFPDDLAEQKKKLIGMLVTAVSNLHQVDKILPAVEDLGKRHVGYGVKPALRTGRRGAVVDAGKGPWRRFHAAGQGGMDGNLRDACGCDAGRGRPSFRRHRIDKKGIHGTPVRLTDRFVGHCLCAKLAIRRSRCAQRGCRNRPVAAARAWARCWNATCIA